MHKQTRLIGGPSVPLMVGAALVALVLMGAPPAFGQVDANGYITSTSWLALGPFANPFGCSGSDASILCNHIAPSIIYCQYPEDGDEIDYDSAQACSTGYSGPTGATGKPKWVPFDDGSNNCLNDLDGDAADTLDDVVKFLATYFEYAGSSPIPVQFCGNSDDGLQVWLDDALIINDNACRGAGDCAAGACDDLVTVAVTPGLHRIMAAAWDDGGGWALSLGLRVGGVAVTTNPDFVFYGTTNPGLAPGCVEVPFRDVENQADAFACPPGAQGPLVVTVTQAGGTATDTVTVVETIAGPISAADVTADSGGTVTAARPGFIEQWLFLGPYVPIRPGANPVVADMRLDYLSDGAAITEATVTPKAGDTVNTAFDAVSGPSTGLAGSGAINPGGVPTWGLRLDTDDTISFTDYYGGDVDNIMMYALCYVNFASAASSLYLGVGSDDAIQVLFDGAEVGINSVARGWGGPQQVQDVFALPGPIAAGTHRVMVKVFDGGGSHGFRLRFQDAAGNPVTAGITVSLDPSGAPTTTFPEEGAGATITWTVERSVLQGAGVGYTANVSVGTFLFGGSVAGKTTAGIFDYALAAPPGDFGPFDMGDPEDDLAHGNEIGVTCTGAAITQPGGADTIAITAGGADIWGAADQFVYAYSAVTGDFTVTVEVTDHVMGNNEWAKHGIMVRENCSAGSRFFFNADQHTETVFTNATGLQFRDAQGGSANLITTPLPAASHTGRFKVERIGSTFVGYAYNQDERTGAEIVAGGPEWIELGRRDWTATGAPAPDTVQVGLAVTSHDGCNLVTVTFEDYDVILGTPPQAPTGAVCSAGAEGAVDVTWQLVGRPAGSQKVLVNGAEVATLAGTDTSTTIPAASLTEGQNKICISNDLGSTCCGYLNDDELYINCGGPKLGPGTAFVLGDGRTWQEDSIASPSPFLASPNLHTGDDATGINPPAIWAPCNTSLVVPEFVDYPTRSRLFATERWDDADIKYRIPLSQGTYDVTLLFAEGCCSDGCEDIADPQLSAGGCRVVDLYVNGNLVADQFARHVEAQKALGNPLPNAIWGVALAKGPYKVEDTNLIEITIDDLGTGTNPPENASIRGIAIWPSKPVEICDNTIDDDGDELADCADPDCASAPNCQRKKFYRADPNDDGTTNITDGIYTLNFLFLGGPPPTCRESADADNDGQINITDGIYILNFLFLGGPAPKAPGVPGKGDPCGPDTDEPGSAKDLGCDVYTSCPP